MCASLSFCCCAGGVVVGAGVDAWLRWISCCTVSGAFGSGSIGMCGHWVEKHLGCHDSPQLFVFRTLHSRPWKSQLHTEHVALVCGTRCGCMMVYERVGRTMERRCRLERVVVLSLRGVVCVPAGPGLEASPMMVPRFPYRALRCGLVGGSGVVGSWYGLWSPSNKEEKVRSCCGCFGCCVRCGRLAWCRRACS